MRNSQTNNKIDLELLRFVTKGVSIKTGLFLFIISAPLFAFSNPLIQSKASRIIKFKKQVMIADNCYYVDSKGIRYGFSFSESLKSLNFIGPNSQEFVLESNGNSDIKFYSLRVKRGGQQLMIYNDFVSIGEKNDFNNRKVGWIVDLNKDGVFDLLQRDKLQIFGNSSNNSNSDRKTASSASIYKTDVINFRVWDKATRSFIERYFHSKRQREAYYKEYDFKFLWKDLP